MRDHGISVGDVLSGVSILYIFKPGSQVKAQTKCTKCGNERSWPIAILKKGIKCDGCRKMKMFKKRIGETFGYLTVSDVRLGNTKNCFVDCVCGNGGWYPWSVLKTMSSCGCRQYENKANSLKIKDVKMMFSYCGERGELTRISTGRVVKTVQVEIGGKKYKVMDLCWFIGHGKFPKYKVFGKSLRMCDMVSKLNMEKSKVETFSALGAREAKKCHTGGLCSNYRICGDRDFLCDCLGRE